VSRLPGVGVPSRPARGLLCCGLLALNGCTMLGPDYQEPEVAWLSGWQPDLYGEVALPAQQAEEDLRFWWDMFNDPALNRLIEAARQDNPSLRIAGLRILESRAQLGIAGSNLYPQLQQLNGAIDRVHNRRRGGDLPNDDQTFTSYQAGFNLAWELDFWGRFRRGIESADAAFFASIANQQDAQVLLSAQVTDLYFSYRTTQLRIGIARDNAAIQKRSYEIAERIYKSGQDSELDQQQARTQYLATLSTIPQLEITLANLRNALCALLGRPPGHLPELEGPVKTLPGMDVSRFGEIPARLLLRRPDVRAAAWQVAAQSAQIGIAEADVYPAISLFGGIGWATNTLSGTPDTTTLSLGPHLTWNIFDHGRVANNVRVQDARLQQLIESYQDRLLQAAREIDDAAIGVVKTREQEAVLAQSVEASERALALASKLYQEGYTDFQRVLDAQRAVFSQAERRLVNQGNHVSAVISLYKALGGGWQPTSVEQVVAQPVRETMQERSDWGDLLTAPLPTNADEPPSTSRTSRHD
jgi:NodT family efflux transporter outer membrane factor (OMF) lipoprotein